MDNFIIAMSRYKRRKYESVIEITTELLENNPSDQAAWLLKCHALIRNTYIDDIEVDEEGAGDILLDENSRVNTVARPGTSFQRPMSKGGENNPNNPNPMIRPMSKSGRPITGFVRPGTNTRPNTGAQGLIRVETALRGNRPGTNRPITSGGRFTNKIIYNRYLRLGTASLNQLQQGNAFLSVERLNVSSISKKDYLSKAICDYLLYVDHNPKKALELAAEATVHKNYSDWWWKVRLGKCYFLLGLYRDAEKQFLSALKNQDMIQIHLELGRVYNRLDQPVRTLEILNNCLQKYPTEISFLLGIGRVHDMLNDYSKAADFYRKVLSYESCNLEAVACIASYHFYIDQPEVALRFYKRLVQLGVSNAELWNNMALCCFYDGQYDLFFSCIEKALLMADDQNIADIWYNVSHIFINVGKHFKYKIIGELGMAYQALRIAISLDTHHAESYNNLGVLELKRNNIDNAKYEFGIAIKEGEFLLEPNYNMALLAFNICDYQESYKLVNKTLQNYPDLVEAKELAKNLEEILTIM